MAANLPFFFSVQSVISPPLAALTSDQEVFPHQLAQSSLDIRNRVANSSVQKPPFHDAFHRVLCLRVLYVKGEDFISQPAV